MTPNTPIQFDKYLVPRGLQPGETALPEDTPADSLPALNEGAYAQLQEMGFPAPRAEKALRMTGNESADVAMQWLFEHMEDEDIDVPFSGGAGGGVVEVDVESLNGLMGMGFEEAHARKALRETVTPHPTRLDISIRTRD